MKILNAISKRHSTRAFRPEMIADDELETIIEAGRLAPTGMNDRANRIYVFRQGEALDRLQTALVNAASRGSADGITKEKAEKMRNDGYSFCYGAPCFILTTHRGNQYNALSNGACMLENMMIQAQESGIGVCWINLVRRAQNDEEVRTVLRKFGIDDDEFVTGGLAAGYADGDYSHEHTEEGNEVIYIE